MKFGEQKVSSMLDNELKAAYIHLAEMDNFRTSKIMDNQERWDKKFKHQPEAKINQNFLDLQNAILDELKKRDISF